MGLMPLIIYSLGGGHTYTHTHTHSHTHTHTDFPHRIKFKKPGMHQSKADIWFEMYCRNLLVAIV